MIPYPRPADQQAAPPIKVIGVGNAGTHLADQLTLRGVQGTEMIVMNTDSQSLAASVVARKALLGARTTHGLGCGGDPELGYEAASESIEEIRFAVQGAAAIILLAGLGGGTGCGAIQLVAEIAKQEGVFLVGMVTTPFSFEGRRRILQAREACRTLGEQAQAVLVFENDRMTELSSPSGGIGETFAASDRMLAASVYSILEMLSARGPVPIHLGTLLAALQGASSSAVFGRGESVGDNRAHEALEAALRSPLLDQGRLLEAARRVIVQISGPQSLSFSEVAAIMREVSKKVSESSQLFLGVGAHASETGPLSVTLLATCDGDVAEESRAARQARQSTASRLPHDTPARNEPPTASAHHPPISDPIPDQPATPTQHAAPAPRPDPKEPDPLPAPKPPARPKHEPPPKPKVRQETFALDSVARGRFEKSEPTIVEGEDLDVPTFLRIQKKS